MLLKLLPPTKKPTYQRKFKLLLAQKNEGTYVPVITITKRMNETFPSGTARPRSFRGRASMPRAAARWSRASRPGYARSGFRTAKRKATRWAGCAAGVRCTTSSAAKTWECCSTGAGGRAHAAWATTFSWASPRSPTPGSREQLPAAWSTSRT